MKKRVMRLISVALVSVMVVGLVGCGSSSDQASSSATSAEGESSVQTVETGKLHMATNAAFPPYEMTTDDGGYEGIDVEIAEKIADKLGLELVVDDMDFSAVITSVQNGKEDIAMAGLTVSDERKKNVDFTESYAEGIQKVIVPEDSDIQSIDDLANDKMIGTQEGTTGYFYCSASTDDGGFGEDHVLAYTNGAVAIQALEAGKVDAVVIDSQPAKEYVKRNKGLRLLDTDYVKEEYAIGISKNNPKLRKAVNNALKELIKDGTVQQILDKYIKADDENSD